MGIRTDIRGGDFHCHVDLHPNPLAIIQECERLGIVVLAVTTTPRAWTQNREWTENSRYVYAAVGLHPELVGQRYEEVSLLEDFMSETRLIGEIGLDGSPRHRKSWKRQVEVFSRALKRASTLGDRVLSVHSRRAANQVVETIALLTRADRVLPILHWYSGSKATARKALDHGCYFSVNPRMLMNKTGRELVESLPRERLLIETDAPFASVDNRKYDPALAIRTAEQVALLKGIPPKEFSELLGKNTRNVLEFAGISL